MCCQFTTHLNGRRIDLEAGTGAVEFCCGELGLRPGLYHLDVFVERFPQLIDWQHRCATLRVDPGKTVYGDFYMPHEWRLAHGNGLGGSAHIEEPADPAGEEESSA